MQAIMCSLSRNKVDVQVREDGGRWRERMWSPEPKSSASGWSEWRYAVLPVALRSLVFLAVNSRLGVFVSPMKEDLAQRVC
jgi:hypothetical protein